jgi:hydrogenase maturation protein HypF
MSHKQPFQAYKIHITGIVQGVGFRPFIYNLARKHHLLGWVNNSSAGVEIRVEGEAHNLEAFIRAIENEKPPLAVIDRLTAELIPVNSYKEFQIRRSEDRPGGFVPISPDICLCEECRKELFEPLNRRFRYPFINCTNCGPRFTIIKDIPYDRPFTTMAPFTMCPECQREYEDPANRRFHAQPNACPVCGPQLSLMIGGQALAERDGALLQARTLLAEGKIVAVKGLGGFHLACDAANPQALQRLRERKGRVDKPFALMAFDLEAVRRFAEVSEAEADLIISKERPIALLNKLPASPLSELVAPGNSSIGVMLPYTPLHYLLLEPAADWSPLALVMTSGNYAEEPIVKDDEEALLHLDQMADAFLNHNRQIHARCDDSVVRIYQGHELPIRRSRGYAPFPVHLPFSATPILAVGGELKNTFCVTHEQYAFLSQHIGDMENYETLQAFAESSVHFCGLFRVQPEIIAYDLHPGYLSSRWALRQQAEKGTRVFGVQHHHAHIAACMAEHRLPLDARVIGLAFDGTGYGLDTHARNGSAIWGGEVLITGYNSFERAGHLKYIPLPGGDAAIRHPYRTALAHTWAADIPWDHRWLCMQGLSPAEITTLRHQLETGYNTVPASSMGRFFDAAAALCTGRRMVTYEAQAAIEFEALANQWSPAVASYPFALLDEVSPFILDPAPVWRAMLQDLTAGEPIPYIAARFHRTVAQMALAAAVKVRERTGLNKAALSGGVFQNIKLLSLTEAALQAAGFEVLIHRLVPPNDGGLALGQAIVAAANCVQDS